MEEQDTGQAVYGISPELGDVATLVGLLLEVQNSQTTNKKIKSQLSRSLELAVEAYKLYLQVKIGEYRKMLPKTGPKVVPIKGDR